jgi:membrane protease YdiL (CAAX protease family)
MGGPASEGKCCGYCGRENEGQAVFCTECGTSFVPPAVEPESSAPAPAEKGLTAGRATIILLVFFLGQIIGAAVGGLLGVILSGADSRAVRDPQRLSQYTETIMGPAAFLAVIGGGIGMWLASLVLVPRGLADESPTGAAWIPGSSRQIAQGLGVGAVLGSVYILMALLLQEQASGASPGPLTRMAMTPGLSRVLWVVMALCLAPVIEELLFRGVLYGGYRKALGAPKAAVLTTSLFVLLHLGEMVHFWPSIVFVTGVASAALWLRLRWSAIGPAVAAHFGYNAVLAAWLIGTGG